MAAKEHKSLQDSKILLIEDDKSIRLTVTESLVSEGFEVLNFKDGSSALDFILGEEIKDIDLILLDLMLPGLNGLELCRKIRNEEIYTPILILSAKGNESDRVLGLEVGADDYLTKPTSKVPFPRSVEYPTLNWVLSLFAPSAAANSIPPLSVPIPSGV